MASHWIKVELDEDTGTLTVRHFASEPFQAADGKPQDVVVSDDLHLPDDATAAVRTALKKIVDINREKLALAAGDAAALHRTIEARNRGRKPAPPAPKPS